MEGSGVSQIAVWIFFVGDSCSRGLQFFQELEVAEEKVFGHEYRYSNGLLLNIYWTMFSASRDLLFLFLTFLGFSQQHQGLEIL